jgi:hypothetical protein
VLDLPFQSAANRLLSSKKRSSARRFTRRDRAPIRTAGSSPRWMSSYVRVFGSPRSSAASGTFNHSFSVGSTLVPSFTLAF